MEHRPSPVRYWTLTGALLGLCGGFALAIGAALVNGLIVGGKPPVSILPYCIVGFEGTILLGTWFNFAGVIFHSKLYRTKVLPHYDRRFSRDKFGLLVSCEAAELERVQSVLAALQPEEVHVNV